MTLTTSLAQTLHRINRQKSDLTSQLQRGPKIVAAAQTRLKNAEDQLLATRELLKKSRVEADSKQLHMTEREQKIHKWQGMMNAAKDNREYQALKDQIAADTKANEVLSDEILEKLEAIDGLQKQIVDQDKSVAEFKSELAKVQDEVEKRRVILESELARVEAELQASEKLLNGDFKRDYQRMVAAKGEDAMAELDGSFCSGCHTSLTPTQLDRLLMGQSIVCPNCGRLVYRPDK